MKHFTKLLAVILVFIIALSTAACSLGPQWSYKEEGKDEKHPIGLYIYSMYNAYSQAESFAMQTKAYDAKTGLYNGKDSFLDVTITDNDGNKAVAKDWILKKAEDEVRTLLAIENEFVRLGATIDEAAYKENIKSYWENAQYGISQKDIFEPYGVSYESYERFNLAAAKEQAIFEKLFIDPKGEKAVSDADFTKFFEENYTSYRYFNFNLYTENAVSDGTVTDSSLQETVAMNADDIAKHEANFKKYADEVNSGKSIDEVIKTYMADYELEADNSISNVEMMEESAIGEDLVNAINELEEGKASYKIIGEVGKQTIYFFYKEPIKNKTQEYLTDANHKFTVINQMKSEDYKAYIDSLAKALKLEKSKYIDKYDPKMFEEEKK